MCDSQSTRNLNFMSVSMASQRLQSSALAVPVRTISRTVAKSAQRVLSSSGKVLQSKLADVSQKIAGPVAFKLHHDFVMSKEDKIGGLVVGGAGLGYPRAAHSLIAQFAQGGSRRRVQASVTTVSTKIQGGRSTKPSKSVLKRSNTLPGGRGLGKQTRKTFSISAVPIPSAVRHVDSPSVYHVSASQGGNIQVALPLTLKGRKNFPGGANLGGNKRQFSQTIFSQSQGGVALSKAKKDVLNASQIVKSSVQGGASLSYKAVDVERSGMLGGAGLGEKRGVSRVISAPVLGGMTQGHRHVVCETVVAPVQGGSALAVKSY
eukprot:TRINITY_DN2647_c0_g1_i1.p1 TRINITY_DN2647_c0_g1~~TRINITY_DN2647_c0_g1_i1.p1  ORF type:complete len:319 (-),score=67.11 TRINITY_DN2647_c0_g1_i1:1822-2778(-)